jgi:hypothetical protein
MSKISSATAALVGVAVSIFIKHPTLNTLQAMQLTGFSEEERTNPRMM